MTLAHAVRDAGAEFDDFFWEGLLLQVEDRRVVPVIGPDLLTIECDGRRVLLYRWAAERLAARLHLPAVELPPDFGLNEVVCAHLAAHGDVADVYIGLAAIMRESALKPPAALQHLAAITDFDLYVTTTFDSLLAQALRTARPGVTPDVLVYTPGKVPDLGGERDRLARPTVYHLFGRVAPSQSYAVSDEDLLKSSRAGCKRRATRRSSSSRSSRTTTCSSWAAASPTGSSASSCAPPSAASCPIAARCVQILAHRHTPTDPGLVLFLEHFSRSTKVYHGGNADDFVAELWRRWSARAPAVTDGAVRASADPPAEMPEGAIFVSYTRKDLDAVKRLKLGLKAAGASVWFDMSDIEPGHDFARIIQENIERCRLFIPVISANTEARREAFFFREWKWAIEREERMAADERFILPVVIDDTPEPGMHVPKRLTELHWTRLPAGQVTAALGDLVRKLVSA